MVCASSWVEVFACDFDVWALRCCCAWVGFTCLCVVDLRLRLDGLVGGFWVWFRGLLFGV